MDEIKQRSLFDPGELFPPRPPKPALPPPNSQEPQEIARLLLQSTDHTRDALPYTDEFERLYVEFLSLVPGNPSRHHFWRLLSNAAKKGGWKGKKRGEPAPTLTFQQADTLRWVVAGRLGSRDGLPYSDAFDRLRNQFNQASGLALSERQFWRCISNLGKHPLRPDVGGLLTQAFDSLTLAVDLFNRSVERGRAASVMIFLGHACESLLKAALVQRGAEIRDPFTGRPLTLGECLDRSTEGSVKFLSENECRTLRVLDGLREQAQHDLVDVSERILYTVAQATLTLVGELTARLFGVPIGDRIPRRVLALSANPPGEIQVVMEEETAQLRKLLKKDGTDQVVSEPKLRSLLAMDRALEDRVLYVGDEELSVVRAAIRNGSPWEDVFPGLARLCLKAEGSGLALTLTRHDGAAVRVAEDGEEAVGTIAVRKVDDTGFYCYGLNAMAKRLKVGSNRLLALVLHLDIQSDRSCFKEIWVGRSKFKMYSNNALTRLREALPSVNLDQIWQEYLAKRARQQG